MQFIFALLLFVSNKAYPIHENKDGEYTLGTGKVTEPKTVLRTLEPLELLALCHSANPSYPGLYPFAALRNQVAFPAWFGTQDYRMK